MYMSGNKLINRKGHRGHGKTMLRHYIIFVDLWPADLMHKKMLSVHILEAKI
jgi:hypothetical protein